MLAKKPEALHAEEEEKSLKYTPICLIFIHALIVTLHCVKVFSYQYTKFYVSS